MRYSFLIFLGAFITLTLSSQELPPAIYVGGQSQHVQGIALDRYAETITFGTVPENGPSKPKAKYFVRTGYDNTKHPLLSLAAEGLVRCLL